MPGFLKGILFLFTAFGLSACCIGLVCEPSPPVLDFRIENQTGENLLETGQILEADVHFYQGASELYGFASGGNMSYPIQYSSSTYKLVILTQEFEVTVAMQEDKSGCCNSYRIDEVKVDGVEVETPDDTVTITITI